MNRNSFIRLTILGIGSLFLPTLLKRSSISDWTVVNSELDAYSTREVEEELLRGYPASEWEKAGGYYAPYIPLIITPLY